ncbi:MAG: helix-turn-helix domain-containing protein [Chitinophagales bacterium]|nr:helix-turn-helix domain-containing protein [Chitinophagales bacterium]
MKDILLNIHHALDNRHRLAIMKILTSEDWTGFNRLKIELNMTDGNLASHLTVLLKAGYIDKRRMLLMNKKQTAYSANLMGRRALNAHSKAMLDLIQF